ncbi:apolipoprotein C-II-like [Struthio camelus]|uniref:apolipoprotein C-II-like n=1 Tax=Struthio camelus TaxID=8801 RepID=UPI0036041714
MASTDARVMAALLLLLLLLLGAEAGGRRPRQAPAVSPLPPAVAPGGSGGSGGSWLQRLVLLPLPARLRDAYETGSAAVATYAGILGDQLYHWWRGEP